jgi:hypothetical protein
VSEAPAEPYRVGAWSGLPNYECALCPFSTLDLPVMEEHLEKVHEPPKEPRPLIYGPNGEPLT